MSAPTREITLEVEPDSDPICGRLRHDGGTRTFCGWLELADALRAALHTAQNCSRVGDVRPATDTGLVLGQPPSDP